MRVCASHKSHTALLGALVGHLEQRLLCRASAKALKFEVRGGHRGRGSSCRTSCLSVLPRYIYIYIYTAIKKQAPTMPSWLWLWGPNEFHTSNICVYTLMVGVERKGRGFIMLLKVCQKPSMRVRNRVPQGEFVYL